MAEKEAHLERQYKEKAMEMKDNMVEIKKRFEQRCDEFKKQLAEFKNNNEAIEALKRAHKAEIAAHVQEHNSKYNALLQQKLDMEDSMKE
jgi:hypothetical protein